MSDDAIWEAIATRLGPPVYRVRVLLTAKQECRLPLLHGPIVYAMLCEAAGHAWNQKPVMPDGILPDVVERSVTQLAPGEPYALGLTILGDSGVQAAGRLDKLVSGLNHIGRHPKSKSLAIGKFEVTKVDDLIGGHAFQNRRLCPLEHNQIVDQVDRVLALGRITLRFDAPLRTQRPQSAKRDGHLYFDEGYFNPDLLVNRIGGRLASLGYPDLPPVKDQSIRVCQNRLVWMDARYGPGKAKTLGGSVGSVEIENLDARDAWEWVMGQWVHVGENTRFGFGRYWICDSHNLDGFPNLAPIAAESLVCRPAKPLLDRCLENAEVDALASDMGLESGELSTIVAKSLAGEYHGDPHFRVKIPKGDGFRELSIPSPRDRGLQRLLLNRLGPALDECVQQASFAYRKGLSTQDAARRVRNAYRRGFRWAVKSDFTEFFDSVDHQRLRHRLSGYIGAVDLVCLLMRLIVAGAPSPGRGLPTGAPLSPLLANLFLDHFDDQIDARDAMLVRYADDFLILTKTKEQAGELMQRARQEAELLGLELNRDKSKFISLESDFAFQFLGFEFRPGQSWSWHSASEPALLDDLGWQRATPAKPKQSNSVINLAGESDCCGSESQSTIVWGPGAKELAYEGDRLVCLFDDQRSAVRLKPAEVRSIIVLGIPLVRPEAIRCLTRENIPVWLCDDSGRVHQEWLPERPLEDAQAVCAQAAVANDDDRRLPIARQLIVAKLSNYAHLAIRLQRPDWSMSKRLEALAVQAAESNSLDQLLGYEGAGAAIWYGTWERHLPPGYTFPGRVAPGARDPVNACLNLAQTILHRYVILAIRMVGMVPAVGVLHQARSQHAALASDLQEPLRHLMDLAVITSLGQVQPREFRIIDDESYPLRMSGFARGRIETTVHEVLSRSCAGRNQSEPCPYFLQALRMARSLKAHLQDVDVPFKAFFHP